MEKKELTHELYPRADQKDCDAVAWVFSDKDTFEKYPFKFYELKADEIRANVLYSGLCQSDSHIGREKWHPAKYPIACGHEIVAEVSQIGADVKGFKVGEKVGFGSQRSSCDKCKSCQKELDNLCRGQPFTESLTIGKYWGGYATQIQHPASWFFHLPSGFDLKRGGPLFCAGVTVHKPIVEHIRKGDKAAVVGVGGLGHLAVQILAKLGHEVTGVTTSDDKTDFIKQLGATDVLNSNNEEQFKAHQGKYDFIVYTAPSFKDFNKITTLAAPKCRIVNVAAPENSEKLTLDTFGLLMNELEIIGSAAGGRKAIREMVEFCAKNNVYPMVEEFSFEDWPKALDRLENGRPKFRCVVNVEDYSKKNNLFK